jgi:hypothetical protein
MSNIFIIILSTLTVSFAIAYSITLYRITKINQAFAKLFISHESLQDFISKNNVEFKNDSDIHKENFIKFLSDSRDWAFAYIEDVQQALDKFITEVEPEIVYFEKYGAILSEQRPDYISLKKISEAFKELKSVMPVEPVEKDA